MPDINIGSKLDAKGFKQAETALDKLNKQGKNLARTFGLTFGSAAVLAYAKNAVKAAAADEKAQKQLALALKNVGLGRDAASSEAYIQRLQTEFGILDDDLRPAYQGLAVAVQDTNEAQRLLNLALDISASTGKDLGSVTAALSKAYLGNNTALSKLGVGISKADLKSKSFNQITEELTTTFAGSATAAANSYEGSIRKLGVASANAAEIIGTGLIDALKGLGDENSVDDLAKNMESAALYVADVIRGVGILTEKLKGIPGFNMLSVQMIPIIGSYIEILRNTGRVAAELDYTAASNATAFEKGFGKYAQTLKTAKALTTEEQKQLKAKQLKLAIDKANLALNKGTEVFDMDKIQLRAAEINQAEQLGKITSQAQLLQVTNDLARLRVKQSILALDEAIASGDIKAITAATARLNADLGILGTLNNQALKLADIKSILASIAPKDLINLENLKQALALLGQMTGNTTGAAAAVASTSSTPVNGITAANKLGSGIPLSNEELKTLGMSAQSPRYPTGNALGSYPSYGFPGSDMGYNSGTSKIDITVNAAPFTDPNAIAEAIDDVLRQARSRGTLVALP
jgi:hypothetical protein